MHPVLKRILVHGGLTALLLVAIGLGLARTAASLASGDAGGRSGASVPDEVQVSVPLMMAFWGFVFVAASELVLWRVRGPKPAVQPVEQPPDDAEKLLNELLAHAEAARTAEGQRTEDGGQRTEEQKVG